MPVPTLIIFDVNETLSNMEPLRERFEAVGASGQLLDIWFASTLRDGFALTAAGAYADFRTVALAVLRAQLGQVATLQRDLDEAAEHVLAGFAELDVHPTSRPECADSPRVASVWSRSRTGQPRMP